MVDVGFLVIALACAWIVFLSQEKSRRLKRTEFIRAYQWPPGLLEKLGGGIQP